MELPIACIILVCLFALQHYGTNRVGFIFAPVVITWLLSITLIGVYNINKGFADFKEITILYSNDEYSIVKSNPNYGLLEYDYIVLDAESINEDDFINE